MLNVGRFMCKVQPILKTILCGVWMSRNVWIFCLTFCSNCFEVEMKGDVRSRNYYFSTYNSKHIVL